MAIGTGAAILGGSVISGALGASSSRSASRSQERATQMATEEQRRQFDLSRQDMMPWLNSGRNALGQLDDLARGDTSSFFTDPGYNFARTEGMRGIERSAAARGGATGGNALRALTQFNQGMASQQFGDFYNRTAARAGVGQTTANNLATLGQNSANSISGLLQAGGDARASGIMGQANSIGGALNSGLNNYLLMRGGYFG
jgi:hypothetical protein